MINRVLIIIILCWSCRAKAQQDSVFFEKVKMLESLFDQTAYSPIEFKDTSLYVIEAISKMVRQDGNASRSLFLEKQLELVKRDYGIAVTGGFLENINPTIGDLEDNLVYNRKFNLGAEWNILNNGYFENKVKARIYEDRILREEMNQDAATESYNYLKRFDHTIYTFNVVKIKLLYERKARLEKQYTTVTQLVHLKRLKKEEIIKMETRLAEVQSLINVYQSYNEYLNPDSEELVFQQDNLPLIDLDYDLIFKRLGQQTDSILSSRVYTDYYSWYHEISLKAYARYNYYDLIGDNNRAFGSAGVTFNIPIPFNNKLKNEVENERYKYDNRRLIQDRTNLHEEILSTAYEFRYKLKQFIGFYQKRKLFMERLRIEKVKVRLKDANTNPLQGLAIYDDLLQIDIELVDLLQNMYLKALKIHSKIPHSSIRDVIKYQTTQEINEYIDDKSRSVYVWSKTFNHFSSDFLVEYVIYNEFDKVILAVSAKDTLVQEKNDFIAMVKETSEMEYMVGDNQMIYEQDIVTYLDEIFKKYDIDQPSGIHLDVEPHTFDEWPAEKQRLIKQYLEMLGKASTYCKERDIKLTVSIPLHYSEDVIDQIFQLTDHVYFMCYENVDVAYIQRKILPYIDNAKEKIVLAFRTEDFNNRMEMEEKINEVKAQTSITSFAYHDLNRLISFDRENIEK
ncbi:MAG: hypothetical protein WDZ35_12875 [Crocinitomicaceae bacterium]